MTTYVGGKSYFADVCAVKSVVKTVTEFAVTSVAKFALNQPKIPSQNSPKNPRENPSKSQPKKSFPPTYGQLPN